MAKRTAKKTVKRKTAKKPARKTIRVDRKTVRKTANIARLELSKSELEKFSKDMNTILEAFENLEKILTRDVEPSFQPMEAKNITREDKIEPPLEQEEALSQTGLKEKGYFKGPKIA